MPSSGYPIEDLNPNNSQERAMLVTVYLNAKHAMGLHMFLEWLESFIGAYNHIRTTEPSRSKVEAANIASQAGIIEWDM
jgi:hypothetical protein